MGVQLCGFTKIHAIVHLKLESFMVCKLYLNKVVKKLLKRLSQLHASIFLYGGDNCTGKTPKTTESMLKIYRMWNKPFKANTLET